MLHMNTPDPKNLSQELLSAARISPALADRIRRACSVHDVPARSYLQHVADDPGGMWCLVEGALSVEFAFGMRDPQISFILLPPVWVGEGGVITGAPRMVGIATTRRSVLLHLPMNQFLSIARDEPLVWHWVAKEQNLNIARSLGMVDALMVRRAEARIAAVLSHLGGRLGRDADEPRVLDVTQAQLAAIANVSRSVLSPILQALATKGIIDLGHRTITIADPLALRRLA
jgi:CRP/FNR family transcriptional regulator, cyclic AMP receptor protein